MKNYSVEQLNYFQTKAQYEAILEQIQIEIEKSGANQLVTDGRRTPENKVILDKKYEIINSIEFNLGKWDALDQLIVAEDKMINWSHEQMKKAKKYNSQKEDIEKLFSDYKKFPNIKEKLIQSVCKLTLKEPAVIK